MPIPIRCPHCGRGYNVRDELAARQVKCQCGQSLLVPAPAPVADPLGQLAALEAASLPAAPAGRKVGPARLPTPSRTKAKKPPLSAGAIAGIIGGAVVVVLLPAGVMVAWLVRSREPAQVAATTPTTGGLSEVTGSSSSAVGGGEALPAPAANQQAPAAPAGPPTLASYSGVYCFAVSNDATRIATYAYETGSAGNVHALKLWDLQTGQPIASMPGPKLEHSIVLSPACDYLATPSGIWNTATGTLLHQLDFDDLHRALGFSQDGRSVILWDGKGEAATVDVATGQVQKTKYGLESYLPLEAVLSPTEPVLAACKFYWAASQDGKARSLGMVEFHRLGVVEKAPGRETAEVPSQLAYSRDGSMVACGLGGTVTVRDPKLFTERYTMTRPPPTGGEKFHQFNDLALSPSGTFVAVTASVTAVDRRINARLELWNLETRQITPLLDGRPEQVVFFPDGKLVAAERHGSLKFFDPAGGPLPPPGSAVR